LILILNNICSCVREAKSPCKPAKGLGLDFIIIESSIASNYFYKLYSRQLEGFLIQDDYLALANVGITSGRYFFRDLLFLSP
jgi:hypothetical protein